MRLLSLILLTALTLSATAAEVKRHWDSVFPVNDDVAFELNSHKGTIKLDHAKVSEVTVKATYYFENGEDPALLDYLSFKTRATKDSVSIDVEFEPPQSASSGWWSNGPSFPFVEFVVLVPDAASIELETHKGELDVNAPTGEIEIESHKGTGVIRNVRSNIEIESHKGRFTVEVTQLNDIEIESHKGDIDITILNAKDFTVVGSTHKGDIRFRGRDIPVTREDGSSFVNYSVGNGQHKIELETHKGQLTLNFQD